MLCQSLSGKISSYGVPSHIAGSAARIIRYLAYLLIIRKDLKVSRSCVCIRVATLSTPYSFFFFLIHSHCLRSVIYFCSPAFYVTVCNEQAIFNLKKKSGIESIFCFQKKLDYSCYLCLVCSERSPVTEIQQALSNIGKKCFSIWSNSNYLTFMRKEWILIKVMYNQELFASIVLKKHS